MHNKVDIAVIGAGMAGAAAAWSLAARGADVAVIGPGEPAESASHRGVFASHHDQGRITRIADHDPVWASLAAQSIAKYRALEQATGISFYTPAGLLILGPSEGSYLKATVATAQRCGSALERLAADEVSVRFAALDCPADRAGLHEATPAGHINPRLLVHALKQATVLSGGHVIEATVLSIERRADAIRLVLDDGTCVHAARALIATGAFTLEPRLTSPLPWLSVEGRTIVMFEVAETDRDTRALPSLIHEVGDFGAYETLYAVPPVRYLDGRLYLKAGTGLIPSPLVTSDDRDDGSIGAWFRGRGNEQEVALIKSEVARLLPHLAAARTVTATCALTLTKTGRPYIAMLDDRLGIALGCNGVAAKSCIAIGDHAADLVEGKLTPELLAAFALPA